MYIRNASADVARQARDHDHEWSARRPTELALFTRETLTPSSMG